MMVVVIINKEILCNLMFTEKEVRVILEELQEEKLKEFLAQNEIFIDRALTEKEMEYVRVAVGDKITYPITITPERLKGLETLVNLTVILVTIKETELVEQKVTFYEPRYYLVTI